VVGYFKLIALIEKSIDIPLYHGKLVLIISDSVQEIQGRIPDFDAEKVYAHAHPFSFNEDNLAGYAVILNMKDPEDKITHGAIAHEALHIANMVAKDRGFIADFNNDEPVAYLMTWVVDRVYAWLLEIKDEKEDEDYANVYSS
jgi:hypothetical protein